VTAADVSGCSAAPDLAQGVADLTFGDRRNPHCSVYLERAVEVVFRSSSKARICGESVTFLGLGLMKDGRIYAFEWGDACGSQASEEDHLGGSLGAAPKYPSAESLSGDHMTPLRAGVIYQLIVGRAEP
jgi:hypothetical protein